METTLLKALAQYGPLGIILAFTLWAGWKMFQRIMDENKAREQQLMSEACAREERILAETRKREERLVAERQASEKTCIENQEKFIAALNLGMAQFGEVSKGVAGIKDRMEVVEEKVDHLSDGVSQLLGATTRAPAGI